MKPKPKRTHRKQNRVALSPRDLERILTRGRADSSSVELTRNAKGDTQIKVGAARDEGETLEETSARAQRIYDRLRSTYEPPKSA